MEPSKYLGASTTLPELQPNMESSPPLAENEPATGRSLFCGIMFRGLCSSDPDDDAKTTPKADVSTHSRFQVRSMRYIRAFVYVFNVHTLLITGLALLAVYLSGPSVFKLRFRMEFSIITFGTVTPLIYLIRMAFDRRDRALFTMSSLKSSVMGLYFCHRDWDITDGVAVHITLGNNRTPGALLIHHLLIDFCSAIRRYLLHPSTYESVAEMRMMTKRSDLLNLLAMWNTNLGDSSARPRRGQTEPSVRHAFARRLVNLEHARVSHRLLMDCYQLVSEISIANEQLTMRAGYSRPGEGGMSRVSQYLRQLMENLEVLRMLRDYRTPLMLRYAVAVMIGLSCVVIAPYFNTLCISQWTDDGHAETTCPAGYLAAIIYTLILMTLYHVQADLERPFLQYGMDDVFFELPHEIHDIHTMLTQRQHTGHRGVNRTASGFTISQQPSLPLPLPDTPRASPHMVVDMARLTAQLAATEARQAGEQHMRRSYDAERWQQQPHERPIGACVEGGSISVHDGSNQGLSTIGELGHGAQTEGELWQPPCKSSAFAMQAQQPRLSSTGSPGGVHVSNANCRGLLPTCNNSSAGMVGETQRSSSTGALQHAPSLSPLPEVQLV